MLFDFSRRKEVVKLTPCNSCSKEDYCQIETFLKQTKLNPFKLIKKLFDKFGNVSLVHAEKNKNEEFIIDCCEYVMKDGVEDYSYLNNAKTKCKCGGNCGSVGGNCGGGKCGGGKCGGGRKCGG